MSERCPKCDLSAENCACKIELIETKPEPIPEPKKPQEPISITNIDDLVVLTKQFAEKHQISYRDALDTQTIWDQIIHMKRMENAQIEQQEMQVQAIRAQQNRIAIEQQLRKQRKH